MPNKPVNLSVRVVTCVANGARLASSHPAGYRRRWALQNAYKKHAIIVLKEGEI